MPYLLIQPTHDDVQFVRFCLTLANLCWLVPLAIRSIVRGSDEHFPNAALAIPISGILLGLAGFSAIVAFGFEPTANWRTLLSGFISLNLIALLAMGVSRMLGIEIK